MVSFCYAAPLSLCFASFCFALRCFALLACFACFASFACFACAGAPRGEARRRQHCRQGAGGAPKRREESRNIQMIQNGDPKRPEEKRGEARRHQKLPKWYPRRPEEVPKLQTYCPRRPEEKRGEARRHQDCQQGARGAPRLLHRVFGIVKIEKTRKIKKNIKN